MRLKPFEETFENFCGDWHQRHSALCDTDGLAQLFKVTILDIAHRGLHIAGGHLIFMHHMKRVSAPVHINACQGPPRSSDQKEPIRLRAHLLA